MIGAGSVVFSRNLTGDILGYPEFQNATISYMDIDKERLDTAGLMGAKVAKALGAKPKIETTMDRRKALDGADFVINMVQIGGFDNTLVDFEIPRKYGLNFTIADTTGPGGFFRALRTFPLLRDMCRDMEELCPRAVLLNYSNPMSMNMQSIFRTSEIQAVGLCHSVQGSFNGLMRYIGEKPSECDFVCAGINHMAFYLSLEKKGEDLYPRLFEAMKRPEVYGSNKVRFELMKRLGYFVTESSEHHAEYNPWFIPRGKQAIKEFNVPIDEYLRRCDSNEKHFETVKKTARDKSELKVHRSHEYGSLIIHSMVTRTPRVVYGNLPNTGSITNIVPDAVVEVPTLVDGSGLQPTVIGELPAQLVAYMQPHISQHELFIQAALERRRERIYQAAMFDPLTAAVLSTDKIVEMCDEMIAGHGKLLPKMDKPVLVPTSGKTFKAANIKALHAAWDERKKQDLADYILEWDILAPFTSPKPNPKLLEWKTPFEKVFDKAPEAKPDLKAVYKSGEREIAWTKVQANMSGRVLFHRTPNIGAVDWSVAYAHAEFISPSPHRALLACGSDDGIQVWINGKIVHSIEKTRALTAEDDEIAIRLEAGVNRILVKVSNHKDNWGFCLALRALD
jgi:alpha-galactosidase